MYQVKIYKKAIKSLKKFPTEDQIRIRKIFTRLKENPFTLDIKKLGPPHKTSHRIRTGSYRIFLDIDMETKVIIIVEIEHRTTPTYR